MTEKNKTSRNIKIKEMHRDSIQLTKYRRSIGRLAGSLDSFYDVAAYNSEQVIMRKQDTRYIQWGRVADTTEINDIRRSQWEILMRKFSDDCKSRSRCKAFLGDLPCIPREKEIFPTGSSYEGSWNVFGMCGRGTYTFPNGTIYMGEWEDGEFHGNGELIFANGVVLKGRWERGEMKSRTMIFPDGVVYEPQEWDYLKMPDRRLGNELPGVNNNQVMEERPARKMPPGHYDTGDGFFNPKTGAVVDYNNHNNVVRLIISPEELKWVKDNCKKSENEPVGPRPDLYEDWWDKDAKAKYLDEDLPAASEKTSIESWGFNEPEISFEDTANTWARRRIITFDPIQEEYSVSSQSMRAKGSIPSMTDK